MSLVGISQKSNLFMDGVLTAGNFVGSGGTMNTPVNSIVGNGTGPALSVTSSNVATGVGAKFNGGGTTQTSAVVDIDASASHGAALTIESNATANDAIVITGNPLSAIRVGTSFPIISLVPGNAGNGYHIDVTGNPANDTILAIVDPGVAQTNLQMGVLNTIPITINHAITDSESGSIYAVNMSASSTLTLPVLHPGLKYKFTTINNGGGGFTCTITATGPLIHGVLCQAGGNAGVVATSLDFSASSLRGDTIELTCDGTSWCVIGFSSAVAGIGSA